jgi:GTPase SAR1 family protein
MGAALSRLWVPNQISIGVIGLRSAGKTTLVHKLSGNPEPVKPSVESQHPL